MPSIDAASKINYAELDNAINNAKKAIAARFDFRNSPVEFSIDKKEKTLKIHAADDSKINAVQEMFTQAAIKRGFSVKQFEWGEPEPSIASTSKVEVKLKDGLESDVCKQIVKIIKDSKMKVQASIQGDEVRLTGKQIDDLRACMDMLQNAELPQVLQFVNPKS
jgi:cyclic-di-GMP-binding protein